MDKIVPRAEVGPKSSPTTELRKTQQQSRGQDPKEMRQKPEPCTHTEASRGDASELPPR